MLATIIITIFAVLFVLPFFVVKACLWKWPNASRKRLIAVGALFLPILSVCLLILLSLGMYVEDILRVEPERLNDAGHRGFALIVMVMMNFSLASSVVGCFASLLALRGRK
jgi:hypothetical protein